MSPVLGHLSWVTCPGSPVLDSLRGWETPIELGGELGAKVSWSLGIHYRHKVGGQAEGKAGGNAGGKAGGNGNFEVEHPFRDSFLTKVRTP